MKAQTNKIHLGLILIAFALILPVLQSAQAQTWTTDTPLNTARWDHSATLLTNGLVLIAGGRIANDYVNNQFANTNNCELYNPATGSSVLTGSMANSHSSGAALLLTNGLVLNIAGENNGQYPITGAELYDSESGTWTDTGSLHHARTSFPATLLPDGKVFVVGGYDGSGAGEVASAEIYDPNTGTWTNAAPLTFAADSMTATLLPNGKVLVAGGSSDGNSLTNAALYNPVNNTWANTGPLNEARGGHSATLLPNGKVLVVGGDSSAETYDPSTGTWTSVASMNDGRGYPTATLLPNGQVLVLGGSPGQTSAELYDPTNDTWTYTGSLSVGRIDHTATLVSQGQVVVAGGDASDYNGPPLPDVETYNQVSSLGDALNTTNFVWNTGGDAEWFVETTDTHDDVSAAQSGAIGDGQTTWIETTIPSDGQLSFYWKVSSEGNSDFLTFYINGNEQDAIADDVDWFQESYPVSAGDVLRWEYTKNAESSVGLDAGFLDEVSYVIAPPAPVLIVTASPVSGQVPLTVQFTSPSLDSFGNAVTNWNWNFGDGVTSALQSPLHTYTNSGFFSPSLTAYSTYGDSSLSVTGLETITVTNHTLSVVANPESGSVPLTVQFSSPSVDSGGNTVTNWNWNFGDGGSSMAQNPSHVYSAVGNFSPSLIVRSTYSASPIDVFGPGMITVTNAPNPAFRTIYSFAPAFGSTPNGGLVLLDNTLYGTTSSGGASNSGALYAVNTDGSGFTNLHDFNFATGSRPNGMIVSSGTFYGSTDFGGSRSGGTVFAISTNGTGYTNLYNINFNVDVNSPSTPQVPLALAGDKLYGASWFGGSYNKGTLFTVATNGASIGIIHNFLPPDGNNRNNDGYFPNARMLSANGTLYGTTASGGTNGFGVVFAFDTNNPYSLTILHYFSTRDPITQTNSDGANPWAKLILSGNTLFGTTYSGGTNGSGVVFALNADGSGFTNLHNFTGGNGGSNPRAGLTLSGNILYGTTSGGGTSSNGTLFAVNTDGSGFTSLYHFTGGNDGADPETDLILSGNVLYGTANSGGSSGNGTVFSFALPSSIVLTDPIKLPGGAFQFKFLQTAGTSNTVFATSDLGIAFSNWTSLGTATEVSPGHFQFSDPDATNNSKRFYRIRSP